MYKAMWEKIVAGSLFLALFLYAFTPPVLAETTKSPNFEASETEFGAGAAIDTCSGSYCARASIGGDVSGEGSSANYSAAFSQSEPGNSEPLLEMFIEPGISNLGDLDIDRTATRTMALNVRSHFAGGYTVQVTGTPPKYEDHFLATPLEPTASLLGVEQFALNAVANSAPQIGEDPKLLPANEVLTGVIEPKYATKDRYAYSSGDTVARTESESSQIRYTISMIVNVSGNTPAGHYAGDFSAIVTPVF